MACFENEIRVLVGANLGEGRGVLVVQHAADTQARRAIYPRLLGSTRAQHRRARRGRHVRPSGGDGDHGR